MSPLDPADYASMPGDAEFIRSIPDLPTLAKLPADQRYDHAKRSGLLYKHTHGRALVELPADDVQLGSRWQHLLTAEQVHEAHRRGMFRNLMTGHDPDTTA